MWKQSSQDWRQSIYEKLRERNRKEHESISDLIQQHTKLFEQSESLKSENLQLALQNEKLRQDNQQLAGRVGGEGGGAEGGSGGGSSLGSASSAVVQALEQKLYRLQEELTDLHRRKGDNSQQLVDLNQCLQERDKLLASRNNKVAEYESELVILREELAMKDALITDIQAVNQTLHDEYQTLNLTNTALEDKYRKAQEENRELIERWMVAKAQDAERLNVENEKMRLTRQKKLEEQLQEAAKDPTPVSSAPGKFDRESPICVSAVLPAKAYLKFDAHEGEINSVVFSPEGRILATGGADRKLKLWDISHGNVEARGTLTGSNAGVTSIDFDGEESLILCASNDFASRVWSVVDYRLRHTLTGHSGKVMAARFLAGNQVVTGSHDRTLKIWDLKCRACIRTIFAGSSCNDLVPSDNEATTVISGHFDKKVRFWDTRTESAANEVPLQGKITSLCLSRDGFSLLTCVRDDSLKILDLRKNQVVSTYSAEGFHVGADYTRAVFSPDGSYVACGSNDGGLYIWNVKSGKLEKALRDHSVCVIACTWQPNGKSLVSCDRARKIIAWSDF